MRHVEDDALLVGIHVELAFVLVDHVTLHVVDGDLSGQSTTSRGLEGLLRAGASFGAVEPEGGPSRQQQADEDGDEATPQVGAAVMVVPVAKFSYEPSSILSMMGPE